MADTTEDRLTLFLAQCYSASILGNMATADAALRDRIQAEPAFMAAAQARLKAISPEVLKRDHISRVNAEALQRALA